MTSDNYIPPYGSWLEAIERAGDIAKELLGDNVRVTATIRVTRTGGRVDINIDVHEGSDNYDC